MTDTEPPTTPTPTTTPPTTTVVDAVVVVDNYISGVFVPPSTNEYTDVINPSDSKTIGRVALSASPDVEDAVASAKNAFPSWSSRTIKQRAAVMMKFHALVKEHARDLAGLIVTENGKNITEALADVAKGNETVEYACSLPQLAAGTTLRVSGSVSCHDRRDPLGVVASIVPFNFPFMVPMWTVPIALVMGNTVVLKPSEKVPLTMRFAADLFKKAGLPDGVFNMVQGTRACVEALIDHPDVRAVTFVGSSPVAKIVSQRCRAYASNNNGTKGTNGTNGTNGDGDREPKRCTALGGAKNHLVALDDCDADGAAADITVSFAGCAGQRCMAASVLLTVDERDDNDNDNDNDNHNHEETAGAKLVQKIVAAASEIKAGSGPGEMGPVIDKASYDRIISYIEHSEQKGAKVLLDGRHWKKDEGFWIGPTILQHNDIDINIDKDEDKTLSEEVFGPVLSVLPVSSWEQAVDIENSNPFGNAASIYTSHGGNAEWFTSRFRASMMGVNIGIPVPREPFSFGGLYGTRSKYGDMDITGDGAMEFFSNRVKVTSKWPIVRGSGSVSRKRLREREAAATTTTNGNANGVYSNGHGHSASNGTEPKDEANFAGQM